VGGWIPCHVALLHHGAGHQLNTISIPLLALLPQQLQVLALALPVCLLVLLVMAVAVLLHCTQNNASIACCCCCCC
jgi:hypothetical protein